MSITLKNHVAEHQIPQLRNLYDMEWWTQERNEDEVRRLVAGSNPVFTLCTEDDELIGFTRVLSDFITKALILDVLVHSKYRGRGLGKRLMEAVIAHPDLADVKHFELYCLPEMIPFYKRWGFSAQLGGLSLMRWERR